MSPASPRRAAITVTEQRRKCEILFTGKKKEMYDGDGDDDDDDDCNEDDVNDKGG
jgi:hypothetical protein